MHADLVVFEVVDSLCVLLVYELSCTLMQMLMVNFISPKCL